MARARKYKTREKTKSAPREYDRVAGRRKRYALELEDREPESPEPDTEDLGFLEGLEERLQKQKEIFDRAFGDKDMSAGSPGMEDRQDIDSSRDSRKLRIDDEVPYKYEGVGADSKNKEIIEYPEEKKPLEPAIINDDQEAKKRDEEYQAAVEARDRAAAMSTERKARLERAKEQESQLRDEAVGLFPKIMGSSFDPNSSMDRGKLEIIMQVKKRHPELSDTQLALKIYREMS